MTSIVASEAGQLPSIARPSRFLVLWQDEDTRQYHRIGQLTGEVGGPFAFDYDESARVISERHGFRPLAEFPDFAAHYESAGLFASFANRVMTPRRDSYVEYVQSLGFSAPPDPFEVLAVTLGVRATDRIQVLPVPLVEPSGCLSFRFLLHGGRHVDPDGSRLSKVGIGDDLHFAAESDNPVTRLAVLVGRDVGPIRSTALGYVPAPLSGFVNQLLETGFPLTAMAEHVGTAPGPMPGAREHMRLLVGVRAIVSPDFVPDLYL